MTPDATGSDPATDHRKALRLAILVSIAVGMTIGNLNSNLMPVLLPGYADRFSLSDSEAGIIATTQLLATAFASLLLARRASHAGRVTMARWGLLVAATAFAASAAAGSLAVFVPLNAVAGAGIGAVFAASAAALSSAPDVDRATTVSVFAATLTIAVLIVAGSVAESIAVGTGGFVLMSICALLGLWLVRHLPERAETAVQTEAPRTPIAFLGAVALFGVTEQGAWSYAETLGERSTDLSATALAVVISAASLLALLGVPFGAGSTRLLGRTRAIALVFAVDALVKLQLATTSSGAMFAGAAVVWQVCFIALMVLLLGTAASGEPTGRWVAAAGGALALGSAIGPSVVGWTLDVTGQLGLGVFMFLATCVAAISIVRTAARLSGASVEALEPEGDAV